jgi:hypothetical protein
MGSEDEDSTELPPPQHISQEIQRDQEMQQQGPEILMTNVQQVLGIGILSPELAQPVGN